MLLKNEIKMRDMMFEDAGLSGRCGHLSALSEDGKHSDVVEHGKKRRLNTQKEWKDKSKKAKRVDDGKLTGSRIFTSKHGNGDAIGAPFNRSEPDVVGIQPNWEVDVPVNEDVVISQHDNLCRMFTILERVISVLKLILGPWTAYQTFGDRVGEACNVDSATKWKPWVLKVSTTQRLDLPVSLAGRDYGGWNDGDSLGVYGGKSRVHRS